MVYVVGGRILYGRVWDLNILPVQVFMYVRVYMGVGVSIAQAIRELLKEMGQDVPPRHVIQRLSERGITGVTSQQVSNQKARLRKARLRAIGDDPPLSVIKKLKALVDEFGSIDAVRHALDGLEELQRKHSE